MKPWLYLDDTRTPVDERFHLVKNYDEFVAYIEENGIPEYISFDHDLGPQHIHYYHTNDNINYENLEKTGYHAAKWLIEHCIEKGLKLGKVGVHSHNPVGSENIIDFINQGMDYLDQKPTCFRHRPPYIDNADGPFEISSHGK